MTRSPYLSSMRVVSFALFGLGQMVGCGAPPEDSPAAASQSSAALAACHLDDGTVSLDAELHACDPQDQKKTTICHLPPGNPANAHTLCIGNSAVPAHLHNHGDYLGACVTELPCSPPPGMSATGGIGGTSSCSHPDAGENAGSGGTAGATAGPVIIIP
jgi:hypothetical protein